MAKVKAQPVDLMFRAFSDRTRLRILHLLRGRDELCVCDLVRVLRLPQAKVSRHLAYLRRARLVEARREGLWMYYRLTRPTGPFHQKMLECLACCFEDVPQLADDARRLGQRCQAPVSTDRRRLTVRCC